MVQRIMPTTTDNPWNPFTQFDEWQNFDSKNGYETWRRIAKIAAISENMSQEQQIKEINAAIMEFVGYNVTGNYIVVHENDQNWLKKIIKSARNQ